MGYTTDFDGEFKITPQLNTDQFIYLRKFVKTRRMKRDEDLVSDYKDKSRKAVGLPVGIDGEFYVGSKADFGQDVGADVLDFNQPQETLLQSAARFHQLLVVI